MRPISLVFLLMAALAAAPVQAQQPGEGAVLDEAGVAAWVVVPAQPRGQYQTPQVLPMRNATPWQAPLWTSFGLVAGSPRIDAQSIGSVLGGRMVQDDRSGRWYASLAGALVRIAGKSQTVVADNVQGIDLDVDEAAGWAVSREPDDTIRLFPLEGNRQAGKVLLKGEFFFHPRFSPDGKMVLVSKSGEAQGTFWLVDLATGRSWEAGKGDWPCFTADGKGILFARTTNDGLRFTSSDLFFLDLRTNTQRPLRPTQVVAETLLALSPDGRYLAYVDALSGALHIVDAVALLKEVAP